MWGLGASFQIGHAPGAAATVYFITTPSPVSYNCLQRVVELIDRFGLNLTHSCVAARSLQQCLQFRSGRYPRYGQELQFLWQVYLLDCDS